MGLSAEGVEVSRWCVDMAAKRNGVNLYCGTLQECSPGLGQYDLVILADVIEHVTDPLSLIGEATKHLAPNGLLLIVTPDIGSLTARLMGRWWWHHRVAHVGYFGRKSMRRAIEKSGLCLVRESFSGWRLPVPYLVERAAFFVPLPSIKALMMKLAHSTWISRLQVNINLRDSRTFVLAPQRSLHHLKNKKNV